MNILFEDEFINKKLFNRALKEVKKEQLLKAVDEINYFNEVQSQTVVKNDFTTVPNFKAEFINKIKNARK